MPRISPLGLIKYPSIYCHHLVISGLPHQNKLLNKPILLQEKCPLIIIIIIAGLDFHMCNCKNKNPKVNMLGETKALLHYK